MTTEEFPVGLKSRAAESDVRNTVQQLQKPSGRSPAADIVRLSKWYSTLDSESKEALRSALQEAAESAIFGVLCILDGARVIESGEEKGEFELHYVRGDKRIVLNPHSDSFHEMYRKYMGSAEL